MDVYLVTMGYNYMHRNLLLFSFSRLPSCSEIVLSKNIVKSFIYKNLPGYNLYPVEGDGLCTFHSFVEAMFALRGFKIPLNEVRSTVKNYLTAHKDELSGFSETDVDIVNELDKLFENPLANYGNNTNDLYLKVLGDAYKVNTVIFQSDAKKCWIVDMSNVENPYTDTLYFARTLSLHIDPVIPYTNTLV